MVVSELIGTISQRLAEVSPTSRLDARLIVSKAMGADADYLIIHGHDKISEETVTAALDLTEQRLSHKPMAYILNKCEFMSLDFHIDENVLIPRPDTECVVEQVIKTARKGARILDIGTGSGCIAVSLAKYIPDARVTAVDISPAALSIARENARANSVTVDFAEKDILREFPSGVFDIIVSNPPYIKAEEIQTLAPNVRDYEPYAALCGGDDGLAFYKRIIASAKEHLESDGILVFELGHDQYEEVCALAAQHGFTDATPIYDLAGIKRGVVLL